MSEKRKWTRVRRPLSIPDPVPVDPIENFQSALEDMGAVRPYTRLSDALAPYDIIVQDLVDLLAILEDR